MPQPAQCSHLSGLAIRALPALEVVARRSRRLAHDAAHTLEAGVDGRALSDKTSQRREVLVHERVARSAGEAVQVADA